MKEAGVQPNSDTDNSIICPVCKATKLEQARTILATMIGENLIPTIKTYHAFLEGASSDGMLEFLNHMKKTGLGPNRDTFLLILGRFLKLKQPKNALKIWAEMKQFNVVPDSAHCTMLVEGLTTSGLLIKARELYAEMRLSGVSDDLKLKNLLRKPGKHNCHQREEEEEEEEEEEPLRVSKNIKKGTKVRRGKSGVMRRK